MASHDRFETDILKQLTRIANALEKIEKGFPNRSESFYVGVKKDNSIKMGEPIKED